MTMNHYPSIDIVIPVYQQKDQLHKTIKKLNAFLETDIQYSCRIIIADHGSQDWTAEISELLENIYDRVSYYRLNQKVSRLALHQCWMNSKANIIVYMDLDLSMDLYRLHDLLQPLIEGTADVSAGSRLAPPSCGQGKWKGKMLSRAYNRLVQCIFKVPFKDAQCGFKAMTQTAGKDLLPLIKNKHWFWDTELLLLANHLGYRIANIPIKCIQDKNGLSNSMPTIAEEIRELIRMRRILRKRVKSVRQPSEALDHFSEKNTPSYHKH